MKTGIYKYQNEKRQEVWFRGYIERIVIENEQARRERLSCKEVWNNKRSALLDAKKLLKQWKKQKNL